MSNRGNVHVPNCFESTIALWVQQLQWINKGKVTLTTNDEWEVKNISFYVVAGDMAYNAILRRPWIQKMDAVPSILHQVMKFPTK